MLCGGSVQVQGRHEIIVSSTSVEGQFCKKNRVCNCI